MKHSNCSEGWLKEFFGDSEFYGREISQSIDSLSRPTRNSPRNRFETDPFTTETSENEMDEHLRVTAVRFSSNLEIFLDSESFQRVPTITDGIRPKGIIGSSLE